MRRPYDLDVSWNNDPVLMPSREEGDGLFLLAMPWTFTITFNQKQQSYIIPDGFLTDGASIPPIARMIVPQGGRTWPPALIHDVLYATQGFRGTYTRQMTDGLFGLGLLKNGVGIRRSAVMFQAVHLFGGTAWANTHPTDKINMSQRWWHKLSTGDLYIPDETH